MSGSGIEAFSDTSGIKATIPAKSSRETIAEERFWNKRLDGIAFKNPTTTKKGPFLILEFEECQMSRTNTSKEPDEKRKPPYKPDIPIKLNGSAV